MVRRPAVPLLALLSVLACVAAQAWAAERTTRTHGPATSGLPWALALPAERIDQLDYTQAITAADWLWVWGLMGPAAPVTGTTEQYVAARRKARRLYRRALHLAPERAEPYWKLARNDYDLGELLPEDAVEQRMPLYEEMVELCRMCVEEVDPESAGCWHFLATGLGRWATTRGVVASFFKAGEVAEAWQRAYALAPTFVSLNGDPLMNDIRYGLGVFYRVVPDHWLVKLLIGVRGDRAKAVALFREAVAVQPYRLELQKELAVALLCYGQEEDDETAVAEGRRILERILAGDFDARDVRATDPIDKAHARDLLAHPERACGYSRDGYEEISASDIEKVKRAKERRGE